MGTKPDDYLTMAITNGQHTLLHIDPNDWEANNHSQVACVLHTQGAGYKAGKISLNNYNKYRQQMFDTWERTCDDT